MRTSTVRLEEFINRNSTEETLLANAKQLNSLVESRDFWAGIISDRTYSATHRRIAIVQYFIRHFYYRKANEIALDSLKLLPHECEVQVMRLMSGVWPIERPIGDALVRIFFTFGEMDRACVYLSIFPTTEDSNLTRILSGAHIESSQAITDVAASEHLRSGGEINWSRWQRRQVYQCQKPRTQRPPAKPGA